MKNKLLMLLSLISMNANSGDVDSKKPASLFNFFRMVNAPKKLNDVLDEDLKIGSCSSLKKSMNFVFYSLAMASNPSESELEKIRCDLDFTLFRMDGSKSKTKAHRDQTVKQYLFRYRDCISSGNL